MEYYKCARIRKTNSKIVSWQRWKNTKLYFIDKIIIIISYRRHIRGQRPYKTRKLGVAGKNEENNTHTHTSNILFRSSNQLKLNDFWIGCIIIILHNQWCTWYLFSHVCELVCTRCVYILFRLIYVIENMAVRRCPW